MLGFIYIVLSKSVLNSIDDDDEFLSTITGEDPSPTLAL